MHPFSMPRSGDASHIERLPGDVIHPAKQNEGDRISFAIDQQIDIFLAHAGFAVARRNFDQATMPDQNHENESAT